MTSGVHYVVQPNIRSSVFEVKADVFSRGGRKCNVLPEHTTTAVNLRSSSLRVDLLKRFSRSFAVGDGEVGIQRERMAQQFPRLGSVPEAEVNHSRMVEQRRLLRAELHCLLHRGRGLARTIGLVE